jgi:hypothetical protein
MYGLHLTEETTTHLRLSTLYTISQQRSWMIQLSLGCLVISGILFQVTGSQITLSCQRRSPKFTHCDLTILRLFTKDSIGIPNLRGAKVESDDGTYRIALLTGEEKIPFDSVYTNLNWSKKHSDADAINEFVKNPQQNSLTIQDDTRWLSLIFGGVMLWLAVACIMLPSQADCYLDKTTGQLSLKKISLIWTSIEQYPLREIKSIKLIESTDSDGDKTYTTQIVLSSNRKIFLNLLDSSTPPDQIVQALHKFLGVPLEVQQKE